MRTQNPASSIELPTWYGELGWEVMSWVPFCRKQARGHDHVIASSFRDMEPLYSDFVSEFRAHDQEGRSLDYAKYYRVDGEFHKYGTPRRQFDILIHARGLSRKVAINYRRWPEVVGSLEGLAVGCVGTERDHLIAGCTDLRGIPLDELMDLMAGATLVAGQSSGVMHLAAACGTDLVVWGDRRTYFWETLEQRYKVTWNPFNVAVGWIDADNWQPDPQAICEQIERSL